MPIEEKIIREITELISEKKFAEALQKIKPLLETNPTNVSLLLDLGYIYGNLSQYKEAIHAYEQVIKLIPKSPSGYTGLGFIYRKQEDNQKAIEQFKKAIELSPDNAMVHFELGEAFFELDRYEESLQSYYKAIQFGGGENDIDTLHRIAQVQLGLKNPDKAIEIANKILNEEPELISAYNIIGTANILKENWKEAISAFEKYIEKVPEDEAAQNLLAETREKLKNT